VDILKLYLPSYDTCFACGKKNPDGLKLCLYLENGHVVSEFTPRKELCGFSGILHGGIVSCVIDEALWWSSAIASGRLVVTKDLRINYLKSLTIRKTYRVEADPPQLQGQVYVCTARIVDRAGSLCVEGEGTYFPLRWGKKRDPQEMLSYVDENGDPLPEDRVYRFQNPETRDIPETG
jgi:uncharacterized protein (TIGR00369 family)